MAMSKKDFIALADAIKEHNAVLERYGKGKFKPFSADQINTLASFCQSQNSHFMRDRWLGYIEGTCGKNGGQPRKEQPTVSSSVRYRQSGEPIDE